MAHRHLPKFAQIIEEGTVLKGHGIKGGGGHGTEEGLQYTVQYILLIVGFLALITKAMSWKLEIFMKIQQFIQICFISQQIKSELMRPT